MAQHKLSLEIPDILNECAIRIVDSSVMHSLVPQDCPRLHITPPGFSYSTEITTLTPGFSTNLSACDIGVQTTGCGTTYSSLSDGIYIIKWSIAPNDTVYVEYNHLRITQFMIKWNKVLCEVQNGACEPPAEIKKKLADLKYIWMLVMAAKAKVEFCHQATPGMELYNYALKLLNKYTCATC